MTKIQDVLINVLPEIVKYAPTIAAGLLHPASSIANYALSAISALYSTNAGDLNNLASKILSDTNKDGALAGLEHQHKDFICSMIDSIPQLQAVELAIKLQFKDNS